METLQFTPSGGVKVLMGGKEYPLSRPKVRQSLKLEEEIQSAKDGSKGLTGCLVEFLVSCGMPKDVVLDEMDLDLINELVTALIQGKKKSSAT